MHHTCVEVDGNDLCPRKERSSPTSCGEGRAELQRQGHRTCPRTPVSAGPARLTGAAPACVSGEGWGLRRCHGCEGEEPMTKSSASTGGGSGQRSYRMVATAELPHGGHSGATAWWTDEEASRARESSPVRKPSGSTCSPGLYLQQGATSRQAQKEKRTAGPGLCAVQARDGTQGVRGQSLSRRQAAQGREGYSTLHVRSSSAGSAPMRGLTFAETCWRDGALASAPKLKEHPLCRTPIPQVSPHQHLPS
ncbi:uncharacterized protein LOC114901300 isoform X4 [Monodon monoceros]|uniref:uncharacterized protein LOC114901300 isoform X4 n=1 Tax=Monodon monoceros TaxID=40151 RepID=UPI0010F58426|nr:uncharacterized protein LOC114901300 isoform X4 [Monodon monoceros]